MKIGDMVKSTEFEMCGRITNIRPCTGTDCKKESLTLDENQSGSRFYYHTENFVIIPSQRESSEE